MNFDIYESRMVPFALNKKEIQDSFFDWVIIGDNTPLDIVLFDKQNPKNVKTRE